MRLFRMEVDLMHHCKGVDEYSDMADHWDDRSAHDMDKMDYMVGLLGIKGGERILDVGTGTGVLIPLYERSGAGCVKAIDISERMISVARDRFPSAEHPGVSFEVMDVYDLDEKGAYDMVVCCACYPHLHDKVEALRVMSEALKDGGTLALLHPDSKEHIDERHRHQGVGVAVNSLPEMSETRALIKDTGLCMTFERDDGDYYIAIARKGGSEDRAMTKDEMYSLLLKDYECFKDEGREVYMEDVLNEMRKDLDDSEKNP